MTRAEAKAAGLKRYTGRRCYQRHDGERFTASNDCCRCTLERNRGRRSIARIHVRHLTPEHRNGLLSAAAQPANRVPPLVDFTGAVSA